MQFVFYVHSLVSCWNHGNAHFLRGVMRELSRRGHEVLAMEPEDGWSRRNLIEQQGTAAVDRFAHDFPELSSRTYGSSFEHEKAVSGADAVIVHEWTDPAIVAELGRLRTTGGGFTLLFHDTHHRALSASEEIARLELDGYDAVLAFGAALRERYRDRGWGRDAFVWHEAADVSLFHPIEDVERDGDLVWIGNWGDGERSEELRAFLTGPARELGLRGHIHGVRYPPEAVEEIRAAGLSFGGWVANQDVPRLFASHRVTVHIPRRPYVEALPGIPTIRVFEALACGIPLVCAPWRDEEHLFRPGEDYLVAANGDAMARALRSILNDPDRWSELATSGRETILARHTCGHRVDELLGILAQVGSLRTADGVRALESVQ